MSKINVSILKKKLDYFLSGGDVLFIIPPFGSIEDIALGPLILHGLTKEMGYKSDVLYLNALLASVMGLESYQEIFKAPLYRQLGERLFARAAYGLPRLGEKPETCRDEALSIVGNHTHNKQFYDSDEAFDMEYYLQIEETCFTFIKAVTPVIAAAGYRIVGCTTTAIGQNNFAFALFGGIKKISPGTITIIGGSSCDGHMAEGIASLGDAADYVFSGESEVIFTEFMQMISRGKKPTQRILTGKPFTELDRLPFPDYDICFNQYAHFMNDTIADKVRIWYETSRGCWWADRVKRCTFCGIHVASYRHKSVEKTIEHLAQSKRRHPGKMLFMTDNIIPPPYKEHLLPAISGKSEFPSIGYQIRANLSFTDLLRFKRAKIIALLPGIETLSTNILNLMEKGIPGKQNLLVLRNGKSLGIFLDWNIVWGLPGDNEQDYRQMLELLPLIRHLQPPNNFTPLLLMRFSPYLLQAADYGVANTRPWEVFNHIYPPGAKIDLLATYYSGQFDSAAYRYPEIIQQLVKQVEIWRNTWEKIQLVMKEFMGTYVIYDNRDIQEKPQTNVLDRQSAKEIMTYGPFGETAAQKQGVQQKWGVVLDNWYVPLVTAPEELLIQFHGADEAEGAIHDH